MNDKSKHGLLLRGCKVLSAVLVSFAVGLVITAGLITLVNQNLPMLMLQSEELAHTLNDPHGYAEFANDLLWTCAKAAAYMVLIFWLLQIPRYLKSLKTDNSW